MQRRTVLATAGSALAATAGCISDSDDTTTEENPTATPPTEDTRTEDTAPADEGQNSNEKSPTDGTPTESKPSEGDEAGTSFEDVPCPSFSDSADRTVCSHTSLTGGIVPSVSTEEFTPTTGDGSVETMQITLQNVSADDFGFNPHAWAIKKQTKDGWVHVAPEEWIEPWYTLGPDERYVWELAVEDHPSPKEEQAIGITQDLESGLYAFQITGMVDGEPDDGSSTNIECVALFRVSRS